MNRVTDQGEHYVSGKVFEMSKGVRDHQAEMKIEVADAVMAVEDGMAIVLDLSENPPTYPEFQDALAKSLCERLIASGADKYLAYAGFANHMATRTWGLYMENLAIRSDKRELPEMEHDPQALRAVSETWQNISHTLLNTT